MPTHISMQFDEYRVYYWSPKKAKAHKFNITITLKSNGVQVGRLQFYPDNYSPLPSDSVYASARGSSVTLSYFESQYEHIIDLLRNESPMWISIVALTDGSSNGSGEITTSDEPVGEEET